MRYDLSGRGVCATSADVEVSDGIVTRLVVHGGCEGWRNAVSRLALGRPVMEVIEAFSSVTCASRGTSCPREIAHILESI